MKNIFWLVLAFACSPIINNIGLAHANGNSRPAPAGGITDNPNECADLGPVELFAGVSNSNDNGRRVDLKVELYRNLDLIGSQELSYQQISGNAESNCKKFVVPLSLEAVNIGSTGELRCKVWVQRVGGSGNFGVKLWYNNIPAANKGYSRIARTTIDSSTSGFYFFRTGDTLSTVNGTSGAYVSLVSTTVYQLLGTWTLAGSSPPLPIQLASFNAIVNNGHDVQLSWTTLTEINNYGFNIQRRGELSSDFEELPNSFVPGHGTTTTPHTYDWTDQNVAPGVYYYRLKQVDLDGTINYSDARQVVVASLTGAAESQAPVIFGLVQNYPNPFNPSTQIQFTVDKPANTSLTVFDALGKEVALLYTGYAKPGKLYSVTFDGSSLANGSYFYRLVTGDQASLKKMLLLK